MGTLTGLTAARMLAVEAASVVAGAVVGPDLILTRKDTSTFNAGRLTPTVVTALPGSPVDGQEVYFQNAAMATAGIIWHLRYRSGASGSYKWEYLGGPKLVTGPTNPGQQTTTATYQDLSGPTLTLPLAGDYDVEVEAGCNDPTNMLVLLRPVVGGSTGTGGRGLSSSFNGILLVRQQRFVSQAAAAVVKAQFYTSTAQTSGYGWADCFIRITPVRVG